MTRTTRMRNPALISALLTVGMLGCTPAVEAPADIGALGAHLFRHFEDEQPGVLEAGLGSLSAAFAEVDLSVGHEERTYDILPLTEDDVADIERPGRDVSAGIAVALAARSSFTPEDHAFVATLDDLTAVEPSTPEIHDRFFIEPSDPDCFPGGQCSVLRTRNEMVKQSAVMTVSYEALEDVRWVELWEPGSGEWGLLSRSWIEASVTGEQEATAIHQVYAADAYWPVDDGLVRFTAIWLEAEVLGASDEVIQGSSAYDLHRTNEAVDAFLADG